MKYNKQMVNDDKLALNDIKIKLNAFFNEIIVRLLNYLNYK